MSYRPITDIWIMARPKVAYYGAYPAGFVERARALLGVTINDPVLHVCGGKVRDYPYLKRAVGPNDATVDLDPALAPDFLMDVRKLGVEKDDLFPCPPDSMLSVAGSVVEGPWLNCSTRWAAALVDRPYTAEDAAHYAPGADSLPEPNDLLKRALSVVRPGGRVGFLDYYLPRPPKTVGGDEVKFVALVGVSVGFGNRMRAFTVFERVASQTISGDRLPISGDSPEPEESPSAPAMSPEESPEVSDPRSLCSSPGCAKPLEPNEYMVCTEHLGPGGFTCAECGVTGLTKGATVEGPDGLRRHGVCHRSRSMGLLPSPDALCECRHTWQEHDYRSKVCAVCGMEEKGRGCQLFVPMSVKLCRVCWVNSGQPDPPATMLPEPEAKCDACGLPSTLMSVHKVRAALAVPDREPPAAVDASLEGF